ncbi:MAG: lipopolysaccharide transport periplasmic protein LptA [Gammaproteobacteria bacterium]|nr:lipopolysaccharide transport periplasmic protein LptA [Gammaproteobacteria bacterium]
MNKTLKHGLIGCLLLTSCSWSIISGADNAEEKIFLDADHVQLNIETGYSVYTGNVKISQGELKLSGDRVTVQQGENEVKRITVDGKPAHYSNITEKGESIQAESEKMVYTASNNALVMTVDAKLKQPGNIISSQKIVYDTKKKIVIAGDKTDESSRDSTDNKQRVKIILTPQKESPEK